MSYNSVIVLHRLPEECSNRRTLQICQYVDGSQFLPGGCLHYVIFLTNSVIFLHRLPEERGYRRTLQICQYVDGSQFLPRGCLHYAGLRKCFRFNFVEQLPPLIVE